MVQRGDGRIHRGIAHEYIGGAIHALFKRAIPGFVDARGIQRPAPRAAIGYGVTVTDEYAVGASTLGGGERRFHRNVARRSEGDSFGTRDRDRLAAAIACGIECTFDLATSLERARGGTTREHDEQQRPFTGPDGAACGGDVALQRRGIEDQRGAAAVAAGRVAIT